MTDNDFIDDVCVGIKILSGTLALKYSLARGVAEITVLETLAKTLHEYAPRETERYLEELSLGEVDILVLERLRADLADVLEGLLRH